MRRKALKVAFPHTLPILTGFAFLGLAYGIYMNTSGFPFYYPMLMSMLIFGGSLEFVAVEIVLYAVHKLARFVRVYLARTVIQHDFVLERLVVRERDEVCAHGKVVGFEVNAD